MRATYNFSTTDYKYEILGFEYMMQRLEDRFFYKQFGQSIQLTNVSLEGVLSWSRGDAKAAVEKILEAPKEKAPDYDRTKIQVFQKLIMRKYNGSEEQLRMYVIELAKRIERAEKKFHQGVIPTIIYGDSD